MSTSITYNLALRLKNAGFPQMGDGFALVPHNPELFEDKEDASMSVIPWCQYVYNPTDKYGETIYSPTLSELIEACGARFRSLTRNGVDFEVEEDICDEDETPLHFTGKTPEEAVANLWIELKK